MEDRDDLEQGASVFRGIVEQSPDAIIVADTTGAIRVWNGAAEILFGYAASEIMGGSLDVIIPERLRSAHWDGFNKAVSTGEPKYVGKVLTTRSMHKNGSTLYVDLSFALLRDAAGTVTGALAIGRDCTERYLADRALRTRAAELEKKLEAASNPPAASGG